MSGPWKDAPPPTYASEAEHRWDSVLADLMDHPGQWRCIHTNPGRNAHPMAWFKAKGCEATSRRGGGTTEVWACWPGEIR